MRVIGGKLQAGDDASEALYVTFDKCPKIVFPSHRYFIEKVEKLSHEGHEELATD